ncbi:MAG: helix-turn-helix transcriptional regulator [Clostridium celatum]|nr:helix-turn-helix transcriptional regulator [Clostridium celatum]
MSLGKRLKKFRKCNGLSLKELSALTNLSISFLSDIEHDRSNPLVLV